MDPFNLDPMTPRAGGFSVVRVSGALAGTVRVEVLPPPVPRTPPEVSSVSPPPGTLLRPTDAISLTVTDPNGLRRVFLAAKFGGQDAYEVIHDGDAFALRYASNSLRIPIEGGYRYQLRRDGGWPGAPTITPFAIDTAGTENV